MTEPEGRTGDDAESGGAPEEAGSGINVRRGLARAALSAGLLGLAAAVAALAGGWYLWQQQQGVDRRIENTREELAARVAEGLEGIEGQLAEIRDGYARENRVSKIERETARSVEAFDRRLAGLENAVSDLRALTDGGRVAWVRAEVIHLLRVANEQLRIRGAIDPALAALEAADARLEALGSPRFMPVREKLAREIEALRNTPRPDITGMAMSLASLHDRIEQLPLALKPPEQYRTPEPEAGRTDEGFSFGALWREVKGTFSDMVTVRRTDAPAKPLLTPEAEFFLRRNLELKLQTARLALLERDEATFRASLRNAREWVREYFDTGDESTRALLEQLSALGQRPVSVDRPDISGSLELLANMRALETAE